MAMFRRPRVGETEEDLLAFQERFLASHKTASVSLVGGKRKQRPSERDVVKLTGGLPPAGDGGVSTAKRSKFKQQKQEKSDSTSIVSDIQDRSVVDRLVTMPTWMTSRGFPSVQRLDSVSPTHTGKKKSLFAQQCDSHSPNFFGVDFKPTNQMQPFDRDRVQPFNSEPFGEAPPTSNKSTQFASTASQAWTGLLDSGPCHAFSSPSLISGEGLMGSEVNREAAAEDVEKIHLENVQRLGEVSETELRAEKLRIEQTLGPELIAFLKMRSRGREEGGEDEGRGRRGIEEEGMETGEKGGRGEMGVVAPAAWVHMDEVERDKMEWMADILPTDLKEGGPVRFDMDGLVIPRGTSLPSHSGLYHHGDEPGAAGYTLSELLGLVRSSVAQQRVWSLSTLAKIMEKAWRGGYRGVVSGDVLGSLCGAGLPLLLRYALDDSSTAVISAALSALHSLLVPTWEEKLLSEMCGCYHGTSLPFTGTGRQGRAEGGKETRSGEDSEVMDRDVVMGYLATGLLRRLRYILEVVRPHPPDVTLTLGIITRIARHSLHAAAQVVECLRLMSTVFSEFLPLVWAPANEADSDGSSLSYGYPQPAAMRLMQALVSASRNLASLLLSRHCLLEVIVRYTVPHPSELSLPANSTHFLSVSALRTGRALLQYGFASTWISDCYQVLSRHFFSLPSLPLASLSLHTSVHLSSMVSLLEPLASLSPSSLPSPLIPPLLSGLTHWVREAEQPVAERLVCLRAALHVVASYLSSSSSSDRDPVEVSELATSLSSPSGLIDSLSHSPLLLSTLSALEKTSPLCCPPSASHPPPSSLPSLHPSLPLPQHPAIYGGHYDDDINPLLHPHVVYISSTDFLLGYLRLCLAVGSAHKGVVSRVSQLLREPQFKDYLEIVCNSSPVKYSCTVFGEFQLLHTAVQLFMMKVAGGGVSQEDVVLYHRLSLHLLSLLPPGMECLIENLMSSIVFHPSLLPELSGLPDSLLTENLSSLSLLHPPQPPPSSLLAGHTPLSSLLADTRDRLPSLSSSLLTSITAFFFTQHTLDHSRQLFFSRSSSPSFPSSLCCPPYSAPLLPADWCVLPLISLYQHSLSRSRDQGSEVILTVRNSLSVQLLLEKLRPSSLLHLPPSTRLSRTLLAFLIGNDLFLEGEVRPLLSCLLTSVYSSQSFQQTLDLSLPVPGLPSFHDLYQSLLTQYAAVSYGDPLFTSYLLLPLQRRFPSSLRRSLWDTHSHTLRLLSLPLDQLPVKVNFFLSPLETDHQMLDLYMGALSTGSVRLQWSPLLYLMAVHHLHNFLFPTTVEGEGEEEEGRGRPEDGVLRERLLSVLRHMKKKESKEHILYYAGATGEGGLGFKIRSTDHNIMT